MFITSDYFSERPSRIISLVPSITELLFFLSLDEQTIGVTKFCIHPQNWHQIKTKVGGTKNLNINVIRGLGPDLILANKEENTKEQIELLANEFPVYLSDVYNFEDGLKMISDISCLTHSEKKGNELIKTIREKKEKIISKPKIKVAYLIWKEPFLVAAGNTFTNSMLNVAVLENVFSHLSRYPEVSEIDINNSGAEIILLSTEPYPFTQKHIEEFANLFPQKKLIIADGEMFSWYGNRMLYALDYFEEFYEKLRQ